MKKILLSLSIIFVLLFASTTSASAVAVWVRGTYKTSGYPNNYSYTYQGWYDSETGHGMFFYGDDKGHGGIILFNLISPDRFPPETVQSFDELTPFFSFEIQADEGLPTDPSEYSGLIVEAYNQLAKSAE